MKTIVCFITSLCFVLSFAQHTKVVTKAAPSEQAQVYNKLASEHIDGNIDIMFNYANKALKIAQQHNQPIEQAKANYYIGIYHLSKSDYPKAQEVLENVKILIKEDYKNNAELENLYARVTANLGLILMEQNSYFQALTNYEAAKGVFNKQQNTAVVALINNNIGVIYRSVSDYKNAINYFEQVIDFQEKSPSASLGFTYANLGRTYQALQLVEKAENYYQKAFKTFEKYPDARGFGELHNYMAETALYTKDYQKAKQRLNVAQQQFGSIDYSFGLSDTFYIFGKLYAQQNQHEEALNYAQKMLDIANNLKSIETQANAHALLSELYDSKNQTALAFHHLKKHNHFNAQLTDIKSIRAHFEIEKQNALEQQHIEYQLVKEKDFRSKLYWIFSLVLLAGSALSYVIIQNYKKAKQAIQLQKELADYEQKALHLQMNPHFVFNCLAAISSFIVQNNQNEAINYLSKFSKLMRLTLDYSKVSLISIDKEIEGLTNYLELEKLRFQSIFNYTIFKDPKLDDDCAIPPMLLQPLVENAIIHGIVPKKDSKQSQIHISFKQKNEQLVITILDNGIGITASKENKINSLASHESMALDIVAKRLNKMHHYNSSFAIIDISSSVQTGTEVTLCLPLQYLKP